MQEDSNVQLYLLAISFIYTTIWVCTFAAVAHVDLIVAPVQIEIEEANAASSSAPTQKHY